MSHFQTAFQKTLGIEGGYSNQPGDPETMWGITEAVARYHGWKGSMRDLPLIMAQQIYQVDYWDPLRLDDVAQISQVVAEEIFDTNVNFYRGAAGKFLQQALNSLGAGPLTVDGNIGPVTVRALGDYIMGKFSGARNPVSDRLAVLLRTLNSLQGADYVRQTETNPAKKAFFFGWMLKRVVI